MNLHFFKTIDGAVSGRLPKQTYLRYYSPFQNYLPLCAVICVKIQKITNMLTLGQIKLYIGPVNKNPKKKKKIIFEYAKLDFCKKNC